MPVTYKGVLNSANTNAGTINSYRIPTHSQELPGHVKITALWLPSAAEEVVPDTDGWTFVVAGDQSVGNFKLWMAWRVSDGAATSWSWNSVTNVWGATSLIVADVDTTDPFQVPPTLNGENSGQALAAPAVTPIEPGGIACYWYTARYSSSTSSKSIGTVSGLTMANGFGPSTVAGHVVRFGRLDDAPLSSLGVRQASASSSTNGWRTISAVLREPRPWSPPLNRHFHTLA